MRFPVLLLVALMGQQPLSRACTVFVLTNAERTLFFNNEDWSDPDGHLWFVPGGPDHLGCAYVGFEDGWAQGGLNTSGLAFDWVAHPEVPYVPDPVLKRVRGNSAQRMLETCTTVDEAINFYRTYREVEFARGRILIADRTGASVIIGAKEGALHLVRETRSRGFGFGGEVLQRHLAASPKVGIAEGMTILRACAQEGATPTQYANSFDLRNGVITLHAMPNWDAAVSFDLGAELARGGHAYEIRGLTELSPASPLSAAQQRFYLDTFAEVPVATGAVGSRLTRVLAEAAAGTMQADDYSPALWVGLAQTQAEMRSQLARLGTLTRMTVVGNFAEGESHVYRCLVQFTGARVLQRYTLRPDGRITAIATEFVELDRP